MDNKFQGKRAELGVYDDWMFGDDSEELIWIPPECREKARENIMKLFGFTGTYEEFIQTMFGNKFDNTELMEDSNDTKRN